MYDDLQHEQPAIEAAFDPLTVHLQSRQGDAKPKAS